MSEIIMIETDKLHPHPDNPRRHIGDVTELVRSIKKNGVLQNLTVVPSTGYWDGDYTVIIGHRRLAAAKSAGIKELPCVIADMTQKEQLATMMTENMQRTDLTPPEQVQGVQMLLDLGETAESIAEQTGLSQATVRERVRLTPLLEIESFKAAAEKQGGQITFADMAKALEIKNEDKREEALSKIGSEDYQTEANKIIHEEKREERYSALLAELSALGIEEGSSSHIGSGYIYEGYYNYAEGLKAALENEDISKFVYVNNTYSILLYKELPSSNNAADVQETEEEQNARIEADKKKAEQDERLAKLNELAKEFYQKRLDFVRQFHVNALNIISVKDALMHIAIRVFMRDQGAYYEDVADIYGIELPDDWYDREGEKNFFVPFMSAAKNDTVRLLLTVIYVAIGDTDNNLYHVPSYYYSSGRYTDNEDLDLLYECLEQVGYTMSADEERYRNGTHELFIESGEDDG